MQSKLPNVSQDPNDDGFVQNPYDFYRKMRSMGDMLWWKEFDLPVVVTNEAVSQVMRHPKLGRAPTDALPLPENSTLSAFHDVEKHSLLELEPPEHTRIRRVVAKAFSLQRMAPLAPVVSQIADRLIDDFPQDQAFDLLTAYAQPLTALTITNFLGIDESHTSKLQEWSSAMVSMYQARRGPEIEHAAAKAAAEFAEFANTELDKRTKLPKGDFLTELVSAEKSGIMSRPELVSTIILLLNAGQEATAHAIGNAVNTLMSFPERTLALQPEQIANTVEECLRYKPPLHMFMRHVNEPVTLLDVDVPAGTQIACLLGASCRDDAVWPDGEKFDPLRLRHSHQAFGVGIHACTGAALARLELQIALPALFSRCPGLTLVQPPRVANRYHFHGLEAMDVRLEAPGST